MAKNNKVVIKVDGEPMILKLGFNGLVELEESLGKPFAEMADGEVAFADLRTIFHVALRYGGHKDISVEDTGDILDEVMAEEGVQYLTNKLTELFNGMMGK